MAKTCKICKEKFEPIYSSVQLVCSPKCGYEYAKRQKSKAWKKEKKELKESLKTWMDYYQEALKVFNAYIRARDKNEPCISCDKPSGTFRLTSGHFYPQGQYKAVALDEDNANGQCWYNCNKNKSGNLQEYRPRLIKKIGIERVEALDRKRNDTVKYSIPELIELKEYYKTKIKELEIK